MNAITTKPIFRPGFARLAAAVLLSTTTSLASATAQTTDLAVQATAASAPYSLFQDATLTGSNNTITATFVPIVTSAGTSYQNITLQLNVSATGVLTVGSIESTPAPAQIVSAFRAGKYCGPSTLVNGTVCIMVSGPAQTAGGATEWSLAAAPGASTYTYPISGSWYAGPLTSSPLAPRLAAAKITSTAYSYGTVGNQAGTVNGTWYHNTLIGLSQVGNTLTIVNFTNGSNGLDQNTSVDEITYTLCTTSCQ